MLGGGGLIQSLGNDPYDLHSRPTTTTTPVKSLQGPTAPLGINRNNNIKFVKMCFSESADYGRVNFVKIIAFWKLCIDKSMKSFSKLETQNFWWKEVYHSVDTNASIVTRNPITFQNHNKYLKILFWVKILWQWILHHQMTIQIKVSFLFIQQSNSFC